MQKKDYIVLELHCIEFRFEGYVSMSNAKRVVIRPGPEVLSCFSGDTGKRRRSLRCTNNLFTFSPLSPFFPLSLDWTVCLTLSVWLRFFCQCAWIASVHDWKKRRRRLWVVFAEAVTQHLQVYGLYLQWEWLKGYKGRKRDKRSLSEYSSSTTAILRKYRSSHTRWRSWRKTKGWKKIRHFDHQCEKSGQVDMWHTIWSR